MKLIATAYIPHYFSTLLDDPLGYEAKIVAEDSPKSSNLEKQIYVFNVVNEEFQAAINRINDRFLKEGLTNKILRNYSRKE